MTKAKRTRKYYSIDMWKASHCDSFAVTAVLPVIAALVLKPSEKETEGGA